eukprot:TRINITY_DN31604_c0_g1_i1.p1 TRINITY_DN31604_c0_g1~~TRINITY_DN31604_c0_g1_i1.p1  ORF type:complete len:544 (+),score=83.45 TRINITY_DN31604_c0_g1_i1:81-1712(+)
MGVWWSRRSEASRHGEASSSCCCPSSFLRSHRSKANGHSRPTAPDAFAEVAEERPAVPASSAEAPFPKTFSRRHVPYTLDDLEAEVLALRTETPPYVHHIGNITVPRLVCEYGAMTKPVGDGPWDIVVHVSGQDGDEAYGGPFPVRVRFDLDLWPTHAPVVRFQCVFHHALTTETNGMTAPFYKTLPKNEKGECTLALTLRAVHDFLVDPLAAWKVPKDSVPSRLTASLKSHREMNRKRLDVIRKYSAMVKHPELFAFGKLPAPELKEDWFDPAVWKASKENTPEAWRSILTTHLPGEVFSFRMFSDSFCDMLVEEIFSFYASDLPAARPNSMNNYGIILNEIGLEPFIDRLQAMLQPLGELLFPGPGNEWDGQHCFIVRYREGEDLGLDMHTDDSEVTFNVCLGLDFEGAGLQICGMLGAPNHRKYTYTYKHIRGQCVVHSGRRRHGADDIATGERLNLILWNHSSTYRDTDEYQQVEYNREETAPDPVCVSYTHDRDYGNFQEYPADKESFRGRGWCPRPEFEYDGFKADCEDEEPVCGCY